MGYQYNSLAWIVVQPILLWRCCTYKGIVSVFWPMRLSELYICIWMNTRWFITVLLYMNIFYSCLCIIYFDILTFFMFDMYSFHNEYTYRYEMVSHKICVQFQLSRSAECHVWKRELILFWYSIQNISAMKKVASVYHGFLETTESVVRQNW